MSTGGPLSHIDLSVSDPGRSIPFYDVFLRALGYRRQRVELAGFTGARPERAAWAIGPPKAPGFAIEVRPASGAERNRAVDRYAPGLHHLAFRAESRAAVDAIHAAVRDAGGDVLDAPADYTGHAAYADGYYAAFFADPDGVKLEVVHTPATGGGGDP